MAAKRWVGSSSVLMTPLKLWRLKTSSNVVYAPRHLSSCLFTNWDCPKKQFYRHPSFKINGNMSI